MNETEFNSAQESEIDHWLPYQLSKSKEKSGEWQMGKRAHSDSGEVTHWVIYDTDSTSSLSGPDIIWSPWTWNHTMDDFERRRELRRQKREEMRLEAER